MRGQITLRLVMQEQVRLEKDITVCSGSVRQMIAQDMIQNGTVSQVGHSWTYTFEEKTDKTE